MEDREAYIKHLEGVCRIYLTREFRRLPQYLRRCKEDEWVEKRMRTGYGNTAIRKTRKYLECYGE